MDQILLVVGSRAVTLGEVLVIGAGAVFVLLLLLVVLVWRASTARAVAEAASAERTHEMEARLASLMQTHAEMTGRMQTMAEVFGSRQADLTRALSDRLDGLTTKIGAGMSDTTRKTQESLAKVHERLAVIDQAQSNIQELSGQVVQLSQVLSNKQTRGAFGQGRMEVIIKDGLPQGAYQFQATLSNNSRPDALITMPNGAPPLVIDAKFPLEGWSAVREAHNAEADKAARQRFTQDIQNHIKAIAEKYLIPGETQDMAFMFMPSESVFAEIHENFEALVNKAQRARIVIVSPSLLMLSIQVIQAVLKDVRMREQAHLIQKEVAFLAADMARLDERVRKLQTHFGQANQDIEQILTTTSKVMKRSGKIEALDFDEAALQEKSAEREEQPEAPRDAPEAALFRQRDLIAGE
ncbi:MAG: DNA recombination protein RmuC [Hyphomicrobiales bacterium]|nr:DNA recombination protein RmuC [Hyphomicrobiales bacterium]